MIQGFFVLSSSIVPNTDIRIDLVEAVRSLLRGKHEVGKPEQHHQHRSDDRTLAPAILRCKADHQLWQQQHRIQEQIDGKPLQNHVVGAEPIQQKNIKRTGNQLAIALLKVGHSLS